jgi:polyhydroxybutyrate depolymerase
MHHHLDPLASLPAAARLAFAAALVAACSSSPSTGYEVTESGGAAGDGGGAGAAGDAGAGGAPDLAKAWPTSDPTPDQPPQGGPGFDQGEMTPPPPACQGKQGAKGERVVTVASGGLIRTALLHVPAAYDPAKPTVLVLNFHGFSSDGAQEALVTRMSQSSDAHNFIVAYPYGVASSWNAGQCCGTAWLDAIDDVAFVKALLAQLSGDYCIDDHRIYATGMSNGGFISHRLACEMADVFAAISPVAGVMGIPEASCKPVRPVPVLAFHGTKDPLVPYGGGNPVLNAGIAGTLNFRSVEETMAIWRDRDGCKGAAEQIYQKGDATCVRWGGCEQGSEVVLCTIDGGGHTWPGGVPIPLGTTSNNISATETMLSFFAAHPKP